MVNMEMGTKINGLAANGTYAALSRQHLIVLVVSQIIFLQ
jgi:hypothetical protein